MPLREIPQLEELEVLVKTPNLYLLITCILPNFRDCEKSSYWKQTVSYKKTLQHCVRKLAARPNGVFALWLPGGVIRNPNGMIAALMISKMLSRWKMIPTYLYELEIARINCQPKRVCGCMDGGDRGVYLNEIGDRYARIWRNLSWDILNSTRTWIVLAVIRLLNLFQSSLALTSCSVSTVRNFTLVA